MVAVVVVLRPGYLVGPLFSDEAGYLLVAQDWHAGGPNLYGHYFVDRPPLLMALYRRRGGDRVAADVRLLATLFAVVFVASAGWAAHQVVGERGARWAALVAAAFAVTPAVVSQEADGEIFAAPLVMLAIALTLAAVRRSGARAFGLGVLAGGVAGAAVMVKQNFADAVVFAVVLLMASPVQRRTPAPVVARVAAGGAPGGLGVVAAALAYVAWSGSAWAPPGPRFRVPRHGPRRDHRPQPARPDDAGPGHDRAGGALRCAAAAGGAGAGGGAPPVRGPPVAGRWARPCCSTWSASPLGGATGRTTCCSWPRPSRVRPRGSNPRGRSPS